MTMMRKKTKRISIWTDTEINSLGAGFFFFLVLVNGDSLVIGKCTKDQLRLVFSYLGFILWR